MKLMRVGEPGAERPALLDDDGNRRDLSGVIRDLDGANLTDESLGAIANLDPTSLPILDPALRVGPCVARPQKFIAIGLNYADHAEESGLPLPTEPIVFHKATSCISGPNDSIVLPNGATHTDWEVELGVVIGVQAKSVSVGEARSHIAGFCLVNDVSERHFQGERNGQWTKGKSADSFGPVGPWLVTRDEIGDPQSLNMRLSVNGTTMQVGNTSTMIFDVDTIVSYLSFFMTLEPGDVITTGTPPGVGAGMNPAQYLHSGDQIELAIDGLGLQRADVVASDAPPVTAAEALLTATTN